MATRPGFAPFFAASARAPVVTSILASLQDLRLSEGELADVEAEARIVLGEVVKEAPDPGVIRRAITMIKGMLAPVATGVGSTVSSESAELAKKAIENLGAALPF